MKHLREVLDKKNYRRLIAEFGGKRIWVPKTGNYGFRDKEFFKNRNAAIRKFNKQGKDAKELSELFNVSLKRIYELIKPGKNSDSEQPSYPSKANYKPTSYYIR